MSGSEALSCTVITARLGGFAGSHRVHPGMLEIASRLLKKEEGGLIIDSFVLRCGDAMAFLLTHRTVEGIQDLNCRILDECREYLRKKKIALPLSNPQFSSCSISFPEREQEDVIVFLSDLPTMDLYNLHLYRIFGDPFSTTRLVTDENLRDGFELSVETRGVVSIFSLPEDAYRLLSSIRRSDESGVVFVSRRDGEPAAAVSMPRDVGAPALLVRAGGIFPTLGEIAEPFSVPYMVRSISGERPMMPIIPVSLCDAQGSRSGGPPRIVCLGFSIANGRLIGPADIFDDPALDPVRRAGSEMSGYARAHGPFDPFL
ncbi:fructose 1,6-bisphosphatase [Methanocalculus sp.]|uniref:fructose 1,6-bisphosphatase n=1 Tax=Methanocalculus sp. TaxID=2004547 RepID=UPI002724A918|nr:fructose 1,6-bisphosphatase [Methanocalculus sp.]MDO8841702.1 fructose 1,6-bisphosphatase [Methanocalculus sp.]